MMSIVKSITSLEELPAQQEKPTIILFHTENNEACNYMVEVLNEIASQYGDRASFCTVDVQKAGGVAINYLIHSAPTTIIIKDGQEVYRSSNSDAESLIQAIDSSLISLEERLSHLINKHPFMIFIKGTPKAPKCGFTQQLLKQLNDLAIDFDYFDILSDDVVRQGLKSYSNWPTYPQIYVKGELLGGLDIFTEMVQAGQIQELLNSQ